MSDEIDKPGVKIDPDHIKEADGYTHVLIAANEKDKRFPGACASCPAGSKDGIVFDFRTMFCEKINGTLRHDVVVGNLYPNESVLVVKAPREQVTQGLIAAAAPQMNCRITNPEVLPQV